MHDSAKARVLISGGGISGLAFAIALRRSYTGGEIVVLEKVRQIEAAGSGMSLIGHTLLLLRDLGVDVRLNELALKQNDVTLITNKGDLMVRAPTEGRDIDEELDQEFGSFQYNIHRGELQTALLECALKNGVIVKNNSRIVDVNESNGIVEVTTQTGEKICGSALIGADGVNSAVREKWLKKVLHPLITPSVSYRGYVCWRGLTDDPKALWSHDHPVMFKTIEHSSGTVSFTAGRMGKGRTFWVCDTAYPLNEPSPVDVHQFLLDAVGADAMEEIKTIIKTTPQKDILRTAIYDGNAYNPFTKASHGRVCVIGDASHPMVHHFGQGACMAVEDAFRLLKCLDSVVLMDPNKSDGQKPSLEEAVNAWPQAMKEYDSWQLSLRPKFLLLFSRVTGFIYMCNNSMFNLVVRNVFFNRLFVHLFVGLMCYVLFHGASDLRIWSKNRVRS